MTDIGSPIRWSRRWIQSTAPKKPRARLANEAGFDDEEVMKIAMAVREAAVNAVLHGNAYDPGKKVTVDVREHREATW